MPLRLLRLFLIFSAFGWGVCIVGVFASWAQVNSIAQGMGAQPIAYDPMLDYWLRMICGAFTLVGLWYLALALWPRKFAVAIPWFGWASARFPSTGMCQRASLAALEFYFLRDRRGHSCELV